MLYYATCIIINIKTLWTLKQKKTETQIKYNNSLKSIVVRRLNEQHLIQSLGTGSK